jgi:hypothetical protein
MWRDIVLELSIKRLHGTRVIAKPQVLDALKTNAIALRFAPDDMLVLSTIDSKTVSDPHAIVVEEQGFVGVWLKRKEAIAFLKHSCEWELPTTYPAFAQGMVAGLAMKLYFEKTKVLLVVTAPFEKVLAERLS